LAFVIEYESKCVEYGCKLIRIEESNMWIAKL